MDGSAEKLRRRKLPVVIESRELVLGTWVQMVRTYTRLQRRLEQVLDRHGLTLPQFDVLATLRTGEGITQQELAARLLVTKGNVCGVLDRMESAKWVERRADPQDRRANRLYLTRQGKDLLTATLPDHHQILGRAMAPFQAQELQALYRQLELMEDAIGEFD
jgi:DNA-binding MarR family transcriptional regulator